METNFTPAVTTELETQLTGLQQRSKEIAITSHDDVVKANDFLKEVKAFTKYVEEQRTALTKPLNDVVTQINDMAKKYKGPGDTIEKEIKDLIL
jgi:hypothetical protein